MPSQLPPLSDPEGLEAYFTDVESLRDAFEALVVAPTLARRLLVIHGVGGVGKSSLLRIFRLYCKSVHIPVAFASGDEAKSAVELLNTWTEDLKADGIKLPAVAKTQQHYRSIQSRIEAQARKDWGALNKVSSLAGKFALKTAEGAAGAMAGSAIGSIIPGIGTLAGTMIGALVGSSGEAVIDWLSGFLNKPEVDLLLDPSKSLTQSFVEDLARVAPKRRLVVMLDTFEQIFALDSWICALAQRLHPNVLLVIAGRAMPDWSRQWPDWLAQADVQELKPMTPSVMRSLVRRYYATMRGGTPDPAQVNAIVSFARGLPIVVTSAVRLWVQYGVEDFQTVKPQVVADLVDRLLEGVPSEIIPVLEVAAAVRWFNKDILRTMTGQDDVNAVYNELRRFPFTRPRAEGLVLHDAVREIMNDNLRVHDLYRYRELHERAAAYFEARLTKATAQEAERIRLEQLYHRVCINEQAGIQLFQMTAEELVRYRLVNRLRALLNDVNTYFLEQKNSLLWWQYYDARLAHLEARVADAEKIYQMISEEAHAEPKLRAYSLCDWGELLAKYEHLGQASGIERATRVLGQSLRMGLIDFHLCKSFFSLARVARYEGRWERDKEYLEQARQFFEQRGDNHGLVYLYSEMKPANARRGLWKEFFKVHEFSLTALSRLPKEPMALRVTVDAVWLWAWALAGRAAECERHARDGLAITRRLHDNVTSLRLLRDLGWTLSVQGRFDEADACFRESLDIAQRLGTLQLSEQGYTLGFWGAMLTRRGQVERAESYLTRSIEIKQTVRVFPGILESLTWLGSAFETQGKWSDALSQYQRGMEWKWYADYYFTCAVLTGIVRVKHAQDDYAAISGLVVEAEQLAQQYEYYDHLSSLRLTQGHVAWEGSISEWGRGFDAGLRFYQHALVCALRYNRFLLDEVLWGGGIITPLQPIIPHCRKRGDEGRQMLRALRHWWKTGVNDLGMTWTDTISPIPEGIGLLDAERMARERESGDGSPQITVVEQIDRAL